MNKPSNAPLKTFIQGKKGDCNIRHLNSPMTTSKVDVGGYMRLAQEDNRLRILNSGVTGWICWGKNKTPQKSKNHILSTVRNSIPKPFRAYVVYNYHDKCIQILELTQIIIIDEVNKLIMDPNYGPPINYDIRIIKRGFGKRTRYQLLPCAQKPLDKEVEIQYKSLEIDFEKIFIGGNPFKRK